MAATANDVSIKSFLHISIHDTLPQKLPITSTHTPNIGIERDEMVMAYDAQILQSYAKAHVISYLILHFLCLNSVSLAYPHYIWASKVVAHYSYRKCFNTKGFKILLT